MIIVVLGTSNIRSVPLHVVVDPSDSGGLGVATAFQVEQVRAVSSARIEERLGRLDSMNRHAVDEILRNALGL